MPPKGFKCSEETRLKMSKSHKGKPSNRKGQQDSELTKQNKSIAHLGKKCSEEAKLKLHKFHIGKKLSEESKRKMSESWKPSHKRVKSQSGYYKGILYQSSYELKFMQLLDEFKIPYERADNKKFRVKYIFNESEHYYYPDFYLPREDLVVEIKSSYQLVALGTQIKLEAAKCKYGKNFLVVTEQELPELKG